MLYLILHYAIPVIKAHRTRKVFFTTLQWQHMSTLLYHHCLSKWLLTCLALSHYLNQCWFLFQMGHGPLTRYVKLRVAHAPGMLGTFSPAAVFKGNCLLATPSCITARAPRTCRDACRDRLPYIPVPSIPGACAFAILWSGKRPIVNKLQWNYNEDRTVCIQENEFENVVCQKLSPFLSFHVLFCHIRQQ